MRRHVHRIVSALLLLALGSWLAPPSGAASSATIGISGHWVVEVQDPNGTPVAREEFHNELVDLDLIPRILARQRTPGNFLIALACDGSGCSSPCSPSECLITMSNVSTSPNVFKNLTASVTSNGSLVLRGQAVASANATVARFSTRFLTCAVSLSISPASCANAPSQSSQNFSQFTATIRPPITVVAGQAIVVTVTMSFVTGTTP